MRARVASPPPTYARRRLHLDVRRRPHHPAATDRRGHDQEPGRRARTAGRRCSCFLMRQHRHLVMVLPGVLQDGGHARGGLPCTAARRRGRVKSWR